MSSKQVYSVTRCSPFTGHVNVLELSLFPDDVDKWNKKQIHIQDCFPYLTTNEREFILTGIFPGEI